MVIKEYAYTTTLMCINNDWKKLPLKMWSPMLKHAQVLHGD